MNKKLENIEDELKEKMELEKAVFDTQLNEIESINNSLLEYKHFDDIKNKINKYKNEKLKKIDQLEENKKNK